MSIADFAEELTQLIIRWTTSVTPKIGDDVDNNAAALTKQQIFETAQNVFRAVLQIDVPSNDYATMTTPAAGIVIITPDAPMVPKNKPENNGSLGRCRSLDTLTTGVPAANIFNFPDPGLLTAKHHDKIDGIEMTNSYANYQKGHMSRSIPVMNVVTMGRSDTFVREEEEELLQNVNNNSKLGEEDDIFAIDGVGVKKSVENMSKIVLLPKLEVLRKRMFDVLSTIDDVKKLAFPETAKPIRRLSSIGYPVLSRNSITQGSIPPPKMRRSFTAFPGTPTSSRLNMTITKETASAISRRKSISTASLHIQGSSNLPLPTPINKKSPLSAGRPAKNPKYAHVQSTIPKALAVGKRKAQ